MTEGGRRNDGGGRAQDGRDSEVCRTDLAWMDTGST